MTINQAITHADLQRPNAYDTAVKVEWLSELDGHIHKEIFSSHEGVDQTPFNGYSALRDMNATLLAPPPYDAIYIYWLFSKIDFMNGETARFNSSVLMYNTAWVNLACYVNRTYSPKQDARLAGA